MSSRIMPFVLLILLLLGGSVVLAASPKIELSDDLVTAIPAGPAFSARSEADSFLVMGPWGSGAIFNGQFQDLAVQPNWNGWTHLDLTIPEDSNHWQAHTYNAEGLAGHGPENLAAWCGSLEYPACDNDVEGGYGNLWNDALVWTAQVADPSAPSVVTIDAWINLDVEITYDWLLLQRAVAGTNALVTIAEYDGQMVNQHLTWSIEIPAGDYSGPDGNQVELRFVITSDGMWSDEDCLYPSAGACQIDDITVQVDNGNHLTFDDFEDGTLGHWVPVDAIGSGDFSQLRSDLTGLDDCRVNHTPQVCFVDDGVVVPGTGGTWCIDWCYGPGGFIVNWSGGLIPEGYIENAVLSPVMPWPENHDGGFLDFDVYVHENLTTDSPAILYDWKVRSAAGPDAEAINGATWSNGGYYYYGGPEYRRHNEDLADLLVPDATFVQVRFSLVDYPLWQWDWAPNGTPAPYFDNVRVTAVNTYGPRFIMRDGDLANDSFPASGVLDPENLATNNVRFDSGQTVGGQARDHLQAAISIQGDGTDLGIPQLHYRLIANEVFDLVRISGLPNSGSVPGAHTGSNDNFSFDLPDTGFFYPGDVIHYYFTATQETAGGMETVMVPADTTGFSQNPWGANSQSPGICAYDQLFSVRALPSMAEGGDHPAILIWDDSRDPRFTASLRHDLNQAQAFTAHAGFDLYRSLDSYGGSNMAREVSPEILDRYGAIFYFSGSNHWDILGNSEDEGLADLALLTQWLEDGGPRGLFVNGDHVLGSLDSTPEGQHILNDYLGATLVGENIYPMIQNNVSPKVLKLDSVPYFHSGIDEWIVTGYCPDSRAMNAVQPLGSAVRLAEFATAGGQGGAFPYSAMMVNEGPNQSLSFSMPYDLRRIQQLPGWQGAGVSLRSQLLGAVTSLFSGGGFPVVDMTPVPDRMVLSASAFPNPFNPSTTVSFNLPRSGHLNLKIFNVRGELVRVLADEPHEAGPGQILWSGRDQFGSSAASGVYFYELRFEDEVLTEKMMLVK